MKRQKELEIQKRRIIHLLQDRREMSNQATQELISSNRKAILNLKGQVTQDAKMLNRAKKRDAAIIAKTFQEWNSKKTMAFANATVSGAQEQLRKSLFDTINAYNLKKYEVRKRETTLERMGMELEILKLSSCKNREENQEQQARQLENNKEKMEIKLDSAVMINDKLKKILDCLKDELIHCPEQLGIMEANVLAYRKDLECMIQIADEEIRAKYISKENMTYLEGELSEDRETRENNLSTQKKTVKDFQVKLPCYKKEIAKKVKEFQSTWDLLNPVEGLEVTTVKGSGSKEQTMVTKMEKLRKVMGCGDVSEIAMMLEAQKDCEKNILLQNEEMMKQRALLQSQLHELEVKYAALKYHKSHRGSSMEHLEQDLKDRMTKEEERRGKAELLISQCDELLFYIENAIDILHTKLSGVMAGDKTASPAEVKDTYQKMSICEEKLRYLMELSVTMEQPGWVQDDTAEPFLSVRKLLETTLENEGHNQRIEFEHTLSRELFEFEGLDEEIFTRKYIKKQSQKLIEMKTKPIKSSKKKIKKAKSKSSIQT